jgi:hypothetical protein
LVDFSDSSVDQLFQDMAAAWMLPFHQLFGVEKEYGLSPRGSHQLGGRIG